jgi:hypothetical protein
LPVIAAVVVVLVRERKAPSAVERLVRNRGS